MICSDIAFHSDAYGKNWDEEYLKYYYQNRPTYDDDNDVYEIYFDYDFKPSATEQIYCLSYSYRDTNGDGYEELIVNIHHVESERTMIENLNYGGERYVDQNT